MIICVCNRVSDHDIKEAVLEGCCSMAQLQACTGLGTQCGRCYETGEAVLGRVINACCAKQRETNPAGSHQPLQGIQMNPQGGLVITSAIADSSQVQQT